jgi:hypothetical protein
VTACGSYFHNGCKAMLHLTRSAWMFVAGIVVAAVIYESGIYYVRSLDRDEGASWNACIADAASAGKDIASMPSSGDKDIDATMAEMRAGNAVAHAQAGCDADDRLVRKDILHTERQFKFVAAVVAILGALPWGWYFLLRRIVELRAAIRGGRPGG